jgi:hypothetical protein|tara:strand:+ start:389 stop:676 length:288 start_codon:yes stop_codon:yes gene_type:complete
METELGNPIEYNPEILEKNDRNDSEDIQDHIQTDQQFYYQPPQPQPYMIPHEQFTNKPVDFFATLDKFAYTVIFVAFILGFFMGKTMQPVILRHG